MKKVKIVLSTMAVMVAVVASLATNTARNLALVTLPVAVKNSIQTACRIVGSCSTATTTAICKVGSITYATKFSATSCATPAKGLFKPN